MERLLVASEYTEPAFYVDKVNKNLDKELEKHKCGLLLITKDIENSTPIYEHALACGVPCVVHITVTGLSLTKIEPNTPAWEDVITGDIPRFLEKVGNKENVVIRIDPLVPDVTDWRFIEEILKHAGHYGITRCRTSIVDYYPFVREKFNKVGAKTFGDDFIAPLPYRMEMLTRICRMAKKYEIEVESCAENIEIEELKKVGCADRKEWQALGLDAQPGMARRTTCFCNLNKFDLLNREKECPFNCLYCYWGKER
jgi:DNA repair photolyase